jgi:uncharacterized membrane protein
MNAYYVVLALRLIHIVSGVFWAGSVLFLTWFLVPSIGASGPAAGPVMDQLMRVRRMPLYLIGAMLLTLLSGLTLYGHDSQTYGAAWMRTGSGMTFGAGAIFAIVGAAIGLFVNTPVAKRLSALGVSIKAGGQPPTAEQTATLTMLQSRLSRASYTAGILVLLATACMAVARYVP